jgi:hypothetical protein
LNAMLGCQQINRNIQYNGHCLKSVMKVNLLNPFSAGNETKLFKLNSHFLTSWGARYTLCGWKQASPTLCRQSKGSLEISCNTNMHYLKTKFVNETLTEDVLNSRNQ